jgi:DNA-directed RNA polymerase subunit RPC12/RpoP
MKPYYKPPDKSMIIGEPLDISKCSICKKQITIDEAVRIYNLIFCSECFILYKEGNHPIPKGR